MRASLIVPVLAFVLIGSAAQAKPAPASEPSAQVMKDMSKEQFRDFLKFADAPHAKAAAKTASSACPGVDNDGFDSSAQIASMSVMPVLLTIAAGR
jgi:hypothetical protein